MTTMQKFKAYFGMVPPSEYEDDYLDEPGPGPVRAVPRERSYRDEYYGDVSYRDEVAGEGYGEFREVGFRERDGYGEERRYAAAGYEFEAGYAAAPEYAYAGSVRAAGPCLKIEFGIQQQSGVIKIDLALEVDGGIIFSVCLYFDIESIVSETESQMLPWTILDGSTGFEDGAGELTDLQIEHLQTGSEIPFGGNCKVPPDADGRQGCGKPFGFIHIHQPGAIEPKMNRHDIQTQGSGEIHSIILEK